MKRAKNICNENNRQSLSLTYDLAVAKIAYQIQIQESPTFDNIFIYLGAFHIEISFFNAIGKYMLFLAHLTY